MDVGPGQSLGSERSSDSSVKSLDVFGVKGKSSVQSQRMVKVEPWSSRINLSNRRCSNQAQMHKRT
jgi:hypothetical protein